MGSSDPHLLVFTPQFPSTDCGLNLWLASNRTWLTQWCIPPEIQLQKDWHQSCQNFLLALSEHLGANQLSCCELFCGEGHMVAKWGLQPVRNGDVSSNNPGGNQSCQQPCEWLPCEVKSSFSWALRLLSPCPHFDCSFWGTLSQKYPLTCAQIPDPQKRCN